MMLLVLQILVVVGSGYVQECLDETNRCDFCLRNQDFIDGTLRITSSGTYCLMENIYFNPAPGMIEIPNAFGSWSPTNDNEYPGCLTLSDGPYALGFFSAISIESNDVELNLNGNTIQMHWLFYLQQRWFSIIEIAASPFLPHFGPADFGNNWISVNNILIHNGEIGLSSHHGIHSNNASNVVIKNLKINQFEVAAIALNGFANVTLKDLDIGPSFDRVPFTGYYSNGRFLAQAFRLLLKAIDAQNKPIPFISFAYLKRGDSVSLRKVYEDLIESMDLAFRYAAGHSTEYDRNHPLYEGAIDLFINQDGLPDGSALYGIVLHSHNVAVGGFGQQLNEEGHGQNILIQNVNIHDLKLKVIEVPAMYFDRCSNKQSSDITVLKGPFGDVMDIRKMIKPEYVGIIDEYDVNGKDLDSLHYEGNVLSDAQIALYLYRYYLVDDTNYAFKSYIHEHFLKWAVRNPYHYQFDSIPKCIGFVCNGDIMFHTNKGVIGLRFDLIEDAQMKDVTIQDIENVSPLASCACANYSGPHDGGNKGTREREGTMNTDLRGISVTGGDLIIDGYNNINNLQSCFGDATGIDLMERAILEFEDNAHLEIKNIVSGAKMDEDQYKALLSIHKTPYPNNFLMCYINVQDGSVIINSPNDRYLYCKLPRYMTKYTKEPTMKPTKYPTMRPTAYPTVEPTPKPTKDPTITPTGDPIVAPTVIPSENPTTDPTMEPTQPPTASPTPAPLIDPTFFPTPDPTWIPTEDPVVKRPRRWRRNSTTWVPTKDPVGKRRRRWRRNRGRIYRNL